MTGQTIAAISTPRAAGGISVIRISGDDAVRIADKVFSSSKKPSDMAGYTCAYGDITEDDGTKIDDVVLTVFRAPHSYTGEDTVEISCHGGLFVTEKILRRVMACGADAASAGEFTRRAFENGKLSLTEAEAVIDIIRANSDGMLRRAENVRDGALYRRIHEQAEKLTAVLSGIGAWIDYPDDDIPETDEGTMKSDLMALRASLSDIYRTYDNSRLIREGIPTAIVGRPNTGKSTLMNSLSGEQRSIVTDIAGTTRDMIEESVRLGDIVLRLFDTAGIHESDDIIERMGIDIAIRKIETADLILAVFDGSEEMSADDMELCEHCRRSSARKIALVNKSDKPQIFDTDKISGFFDRILTVSAKNNELSLLEDTVKEMFGVSGVCDELIINERQRQCLRNAIDRIDEAISAMDTTTLDAVNIVLDEALAFLLELTGERVSDTVVNDIFTQFCVGK
ncbi:MAG: tRNA uridine-5-carboxymethylaminomethyl(34) synthesis GTPase MnmE [Oscillospiraceae bacterium]|nr:tRNA uridine-5-carboxymethylaminomethyl(34) synthesis GTPase MnmE [Oscillospiraceae bacterium]